MSLWLTEDELVTLTGYKRLSMQKKALAELRIPFRSRPLDGFPLVLRSHFADATPARKTQPKWEASYG